VWATRLSVLVGGSGVTLDLRGFVNSGLMAFFFLVVGLEARREFDMGELRVRSRLALPFVAGLGGMVVPIGIYLIANAGRPSEHGWGMAMSTDTAFALGALALVGRRLPDRVRTYLLTFSVVDDLAGLAVIAVAYSGHDPRWCRCWPGSGSSRDRLVIRARASGTARVPADRDRGLGGVLKSGVDPIVVGLVDRPADLRLPGDPGLAGAGLRGVPAVPRAAHRRAGAVGARRGADAISPNDRLAQLFHPWTSYVIVPLFALANAGIVINAGFLARAYTSPVTLGILIGYLVGKPVGTAGCAWLVTKLSHGRLRPPVGWGAVAGAGAVAGIGFTVSLLIASLALQGHRTGRGQARHPVRRAGASA
jgi:Na+/H+ antiporter NhaA